MQHYELPDGTDPEGSNRLIIGFPDSPENAVISLESTFPEQFDIYGEISLFCSYAYYWRASYVMSAEIGSRSYWHLERVLTGPPLIEPDGSWALRGTPATNVSGHVSDHSSPEPDVKNRFSVAQELKPAEITAAMFPVESQLHRTLASNGGRSISGELATIDVEVDGMGWRQRHLDEYVSWSVAHLFACLLSRHPADATFDAVLARAATNCLFPSVLNPESAKADQRYFAALAARYAFTGQSMNSV